jgi:hypothetical protein
MIVDGSIKTLLMVRDLSDVVKVEKIIQKQEEEAEKMNIITNEFSSALTKLGFTVDRVEISNEKSE